MRFPSEMIFNTKRIKEVLFSPDYSVAYKNLAIAMIAGWMVSFVMTIFQFFFRTTDHLFYATGLTCIGMIVVFLLGAALFNEKDGAVSKYICISFLVALVVLIWFETGGLNGLSSIWFIFSIILISLACNGLGLCVMLIVDIIIFMSTVLMTYNRIELFTTIDQNILLIDKIINVAVIAIYTFVVVSLQKKIADAERERVNKLNQTQKLFTASMNHELRNPLNGILGTLKMLSYEDLSDEQMKCVRQGYQSSKALLQIVNDLLDCSKLEAGEFSIVNDSFDMAEIIDDTMEMFKMYAKEKGLELILDVSDDFPCGLYGDGTRIRQISANLMSNAVKYTRSGSVTYSVKYEESNLIIAVIDTGDGMNEETLKSLFVPYHRVDEKKNKAIQGTGLGLYIIKTLCDLMNGSVTVTSEVGKGSVFTVTLPMEINNPELKYKRDKEVQKANMVQAMEDCSNLRVLVVDDTKVNLSVAKGLFKKALKVDAMTASSGEECLNILNHSDFDIVLLDHMMPNMDGVQTLSKIREMGIKIPVIALTANAGVGMKQKYEELGFDGFLAKPIVLESLVEVLAVLKK